MEKLLVRGKCVCLAMLPPDPGWKWGWIVSYTGCRCAHAAMREEEYEEEAEEETLFPLFPHMQKRQCCEQARGTRARGGKERQRKQGVTEKAQWVSHCQFSALSPAKLPPIPCHPLIQPPLRCCGQRCLLAVEFKTKTVMKWEFLCQVPSEPERLVYSLMKFLLQSLPLFSTRDWCFL